MLNRLYTLVPARRVAKGLGKALLCASFGLFGATASAQDVIFSQFYANPLYLNPALAGNAFDP
ncbi:MAG: type IX secretion system membrane protein PorP/SprF, partial [Bacteroidota bacterium]